MPVSVHESPEHMAQSRNATVYVCANVGAVHAPPSSTNRSKKPAPSGIHWRNQIRGGMLRRDTLRLKGRDYSQPGLYFVTIDVLNRAEILGRVEDGKFYPSRAGDLVKQCWESIPLHFATARIDEYQIMPDHMHGIIALGRENYDAAGRDDSQATPSSPSLSPIIQAFKSASTRGIHDTGILSGTPVWQRSFYDRIIRDDGSYTTIVRYIRSNPQRWKERSLILHRGAQHGDFLQER
jgi:putative transposase